VKNVWESEFDVPTSEIGQTTLSQALRIRPYQIALVLAFLNNWVLFGLRSSILPLFVTEKLNSTASVAGLGITIGALIQGIFLLKAGRFSDEKGRKAALHFWQYLCFIWNINALIYN